MAVCARLSAECVFEVRRAAARVGPLPRRAERGSGTGRLHDGWVFGWFLPPGHCGQSHHTHSRASSCADPSLSFFGVELLGHTPIRCLIFLRTSQLFLTEAAVLYIPTSNVRQHLFLHVLANTCYFLFLTRTCHSRPSGCEAASREGSDLHFLMTPDAEYLRAPAGCLCIFLQERLF